MKFFILSYFPRMYFLRCNNKLKSLYIFFLLKNLELIYTCRWRTRGYGHDNACLCARRAKRRMADDPVWPDPFRPRIVAPAKGKKKREEIEEPHDALATHESRYHADYLREIFNPSALPARSPNHTHTLYLFAHLKL